MRQDDEPADRLSRVQSLVRAFGLLDALAESEGGLSLTEVAKKVGLPRSTAHRLLTTMEAMHYLRFDPRTNYWQIGRQAFTIGAAFASARDFGKLGHSIMKSVAFQQQETVNMSIAEEANLVYLSQVSAPRAGRTMTRPGARVPLHASAAGKSMMAFWSRDEIDAYLRRAPLVGRTQATLTTADALLSHLDRVREQGFATDDQELVSGMRCVAAPVFDEWAEPRAALSISAPIARIGDDRVVVLGAQLREAARRMTIDMGGRLPERLCA